MCLQTHTLLDAACERDHCANTAKCRPERNTKTRQYDLLRPRAGQKQPPRFGSTICYGQEWARNSHQDSELRFVTAKSGPERAIKTRQYDLFRPRVGQKEPPTPGSTYGQEWASKSHQDAAVRFDTAKTGPERTTKTRQYDLLRPQKEPTRLGSSICYGQERARKSHQDSAVRFDTAKSGPARATKTQQFDLLRPGAKSVSERATKTRQYDLLRPRVGQKQPPRRGSTICRGQEWARKSNQDSAIRSVTAKTPRPGSTICYGQGWATKTRKYDLLWPRVGQKEPPRLASTLCYGQTWARKNHQDSAIRFVPGKSGPETATKTRQCALSRPRMGKKQPPKLGNTI